MTKFRKKGTLNITNNYISNLLENCPCTPTCHKWDDFWDFSRMAVPKDRVLFYKRLKSGSPRFIGNYISIYTFTVFTLGVFTNRYFLIPLIILPMIWIVIGVATQVENNHFNHAREKEYIIPLDQRVSQKMQL